MHTKTEEIIKTEEEYREALKRFMEIVDSPPDSHEIVELFSLMKKLIDYEQENCM